MVMPNPRTSAAAIEAMQIVSEYGALCEAMFLVMLADGRVKNVERDVLRGALRVLSDDRIRSTHIESMLDVAARNVAEYGLKPRLAEIIDRLKDSPTRAEITYLLASAVAAADDEVVPEEAEVLTLLAEGLGIDERRANDLLSSLNDSQNSEQIRQSVHPPPVAKG
jgi:tellurite resistance protein